jgi:hypothetical protein
VGYALPGGKEGTIDLPLATAEGHRITAVTIAYNMERKTAVIAVAFTEDGKAYQITDNWDDLQKGVPVPEAALGGQKVILRLKVDNKAMAPTEMLWLTNVQCDITVK